MVVYHTAYPEGFEMGDTITDMGERYSLLHVNKSETDTCLLDTYTYFNFPKIFTLETTISIEKSGIGTVQRNPFLSLYGKGVLIGIIDTGIDYQHPVFRYEDGSTRILSIWDQTEQSGTPPEGFTYGSEYSRELIDLALESEDPLSIVPSTDTNGHGTAMASIAAGKSLGEQAYDGVVPESELVIIKLKEAKQNLKEFFFVPEDAYCFQESDINMGINYLRDVLQRENKPLVICIALGTSQGAHSGYGVISGYLNYIVQLPGLGVSVSAGNEGNKRRHYFNNTTIEPYYNEFQLKIGEKDKRFSMEIWSFATGIFTLDISSPNNESIQRVYPAIGECREFDFILSQGTILVNNMLIEESFNRQLILIRFNDPTPGVWHFRVENLENEPFSFHSWLPSGDLISNETFFVNSSPDTTITSPGNGTHQLTVTAYNQFNDSILPESGRGYTSDDQVKPDIAAPGYQLPCALPGNQYGTATGTGAAAAHTAGAIAMLMEWAIVKGNYPTITGYDINRMIMRGGNRSQKELYPNNIWGYGQLDVNKLFQVLTNI